MLELGKIGPTDAALAALRKAGLSPATLLARHQRGDQGEISPYEIGLSAEELDAENLVTSIYRLSTGDAIWVTTDKRWNVTTLLLMSADFLAEFFDL